MRKIILCLFFQIITIASYAQTTPESQIPADWAECADLINAINTENYVEAYSTANFLSSTGNKNAKYILAAMSLCGVGGQKNYPVALDLLKDLANQGDERAQYMLGGFGSLQMQKEMLKAMMGEDFESDDNVFWYQMMSVNGKPSIFKETLPWFYAPIMQVAYRDIMYYAGLYCLTGELGYEDAMSGVIWLQHSASKGYPDAQKLLNKLFDGTDDN